MTAPLNLAALKALYEAATGHEYKRGDRLTTHDREFLNAAYAHWPTMVSEIEAGRAAIEAQQASVTAETFSTVHDENPPFTSDALKDFTSRGYERVNR